MPTYGLYLSTLVHEFIGIYVRKLSRLKKEISFFVDYTIPIHDLLELEEFKTLKYKQYLLDFIDKNLMINFSLQ